MIITIALGVMLGLFLTGLVVRVLSDERFLMWVGVAFWIVVAIIVLPRLNRDGWIAIGIILGLIVLVTILKPFFEALRPLPPVFAELRDELEARWPWITEVGPAYQDEADRPTRAVKLSCGHTLQSHDVRLKVGRAFYCSQCNPELADLYQQYEQSSAYRGPVQHGHFGAYLSGREFMLRRDRPPRRI
jgi:hypothetical protein